MRNIIYFLILSLFVLSFGNPCFAGMKDPKTLKKRSEANRQGYAESENKGKPSIISVKENESINGYGAADPNDQVSKSAALTTTVKGLSEAGYTLESIVDIVSSDKGNSIADVKIALMKAGIKKSEIDSAMGIDTKTSMTNDTNTAVVTETSSSSNKTIAAEAASPEDSDNYNLENKASRVNNYDSAGVLTGYTVTKWDEETSIYTATTYDAEGEVTSTTEYQYEGTVAVSATIYDADKNITATVAYSYDDDGNISASTYYDAEGDISGTSTYSYTDGVVTAVMVSDPDGNLTTTTNYTYDNGMITAKLYDADSALISYTVSTSNNAGVITQVNSYDADDNLIGSSKHFYGEMV